MGRCGSSPCLPGAGVVALPDHAGGEVLDHDINIPRPSFEHKALDHFRVVEGVGAVRGDGNDVAGAEAVVGQVRGAGQAAGGGGGGGRGGGARVGAVGLVVRVGALAGLLGGHGEADDVLLVQPPARPGDHAEERQALQRQREGYKGGSGVDVGSRIGQGRP